MSTATVIVAGVFHIRMCVHYYSHLNVPIKYMKPCFIDVAFYVKEMNIKLNWNDRSVNRNMHHIQIHLGKVLSKTSPILQVQVSAEFSNTFFNILPGDNVEILSK